MVARVMVSGNWSPIAEALAILNHPGHDQKSHGRKRGVTGQAALDAVPVGLASLGKDISDAERKALGEYRSPEHFTAINGSLRGQASSTPGADDQVKAIDGLMERSRVTEDVEVWRGLQGGADKVFGADRLSGDMTGLEWQEQAYMSTSVRQSAAREFTQSSDAVLMRVTVPKDTGAAKMTNRESSGEGEVVLERGLRLRVTTDHGIDPELGVRLLDVEVVPE